MTHITFSPDFIETYEGTSDELLSSLNKLQQFIASGNDFEINATSITFGDDTYDKVITIAL